MPGVSCMLYLFASLISLDHLFLFITIHGYPYIYLLFFGEDFGLLLHPIIKFHLILLQVFGQECIQLGILMGKHMSGLV